MLSPLVQERITPPANVFYCDHHPDCVDSCKLPPLAVDMLMNDTKLILIITGHAVPEAAGEMVTKGKGWKIYRLKERCQAQP